MTSSFDGQVAIITGGNSGIGKSAAMRFAGRGAQVVIAARRADEGNETAEIRAAGGEAIFVQTDVSQEAQVEAMVRKTLETYGGLGYAFNNAGMPGTGPGTTLVDAPEDAWNQIIDVNLKGVWLCMKYQIPEMLKRGAWAIVNDSSVAGLQGSLNFAYVASKHGVVGLTKSAALIHAHQGIRVNAVCLGWVRTPMVEPALEDPEFAAGVLAMEPIGRLGRPEEVAEVVMWLCSDRRFLRHRDCDARRRRPDGRANLSPNLGAALQARL